MSKVDFSEQEIEDIIKQQITGPNKDLLTEAIVGLMDSNFKMGTLLKAALGTKRRCELQIGDEYYVNYNHVSNYMFNEDLMTEKNMFKGDWLRCKLIGFNPWNESSYNVSYKYLDSSGDEKEASYSVGKASLDIIEEFPEDYLDKLV